MDFVPNDSIELSRMSVCVFIAQQLGKDRSANSEWIIGSYDPPMLLQSYTTAINFLVFAYFKRIHICFCLFLNAFVSDLFLQ